MTPARASHLAEPRAESAGTEQGGGRALAAAGSEGHGGRALAAVAP